MALLLAEPMSRVRIYVGAQLIDEVLVGIGKAGLLHQLDVKEELPEGLKKGEEQAVSDRLYKLGALASRASSILASLGLKSSEITAALDFNRPLADEELKSMEDELAQLEAKVSQALESLSRPGLLAEELEALKTQLEELTRSVGPKVSEMLRQLEASRAIAEAKARALKTARTYVIDGWVPKASLNKLRQILEERAGDYHHLQELQIKHTEAARSQPPPTLMKNPPPAKVYEKIVTAFGVPNYFEIDPTAIMAVSFPLIFGMMFGDVGQGLLLLIIGLALNFYKKKGARALPGLGEDMSSYLLEGAPLIISAAIGSVLFGFLYGELFGSHELYVGLDKPFKGLVGISIAESIKHGSSMLEGFLSSLFGFTVRVPFPFSPLDRPLDMARLSLYVAFIQIPLGILLDIGNKLKAREFKEAIVGDGLWLWFYLSFAYLILRYGLRVLQELTANINSLLVLVIPLVAMLVVRGVVHKGMGVMESVEHLIASLANTISYARIFAFAMIHGVFSKIPWMLLEQGGLVGMIMFSLFFPFVTIFAILLLEAIFSFMQALRLHWVEWFMKFYSGDGIRFNPFLIK